MPKIFEEETVQRKIIFFKRDWEQIIAMSNPKMEPSKIVRTIVRNFVMHSGDAMRSRIDQFERELEGKNKVESGAE